MQKTQTVEAVTSGYIVKTEKKLKEEVAEDAIDAAGFGKFNLKVAVLCSLIYINAAFSTLSTGFILPAAACDFKMTTIDKGRIITAPILGTCFGPFIWGFLADVKGRKFALLITLFLQSTSELLMSITPNYWGFLVLKFLSGSAVIGQISLLFTYVGEFQPIIYRKRILSLMDLGLVVGMFLVPLLGWGIIPLTFEYNKTFFHFRSWNLFLLISSLPAQFIGFWLIFFPETPKYLAETEQDLELINVLINVYKVNTGKSTESYFKILNESKNPLLRDLATSYTKKSSLNVKKEKKVIKLKTVLSDFKNQARCILAPPHFKKTILACSAAFSITLAYFSFLLWFPEVFQRLAKFDHYFPNETSTVCTVSQKMHSSKATALQIDPFGCNTVIDSSVYINSLWQAVACIPSSLILIAFVDRLGFKFFLVTASTAAFIVTLAFFFVKTLLQNMILACLFESMTSICMSVIFCFVVVIFPTNVRVSAGAIAIFFSRIGSLVGNILFSYLIDNYCIPLIAVIASQLLFGAIICLLIQEQENN